ncbi:uncharacterized protein LOC128334329 [Hemicordylus capensis]|uniref:uncharacterized protein LOC128334329 n=1 Tax=Hemicordylus capensis TaxID=884348 RepID=UPI0023047CBC|nr:uncharacterized protein LOC128334329 [Hemicordylus capensis]
MRQPPGAALRDYLAFYRSNWAEGKLLVCDEAAVKARARRFLAGEPSSSSSSSSREGCGKLDVYSIAQQCLQTKGPEEGKGVFRKLARAFEFLELLCVNLFLSPWRKEIKSLKTFTGHFVYHVQSVLPEGVAERLLKGIGYVATTATEFSLVRKLEEEEAEQAAFELFLARIECEDFLETTKDVRESDWGDILQKRAQKRWYPKENPERKHPSSQREGYMMVGESNETQGYFGHPQEAVTDSRLSFEEAENGELGLKLTTEEPQLASSQFTSDQTINQSHSGASANSCVKSSDSEDFLTKYSDIVIGQKPLHFTELSPKASEDRTRTVGLSETALGPPTNARLLTPLSPDASGPQALSILNNATLESGASYDCRAQVLIEAKINEAMNCPSAYRTELRDEPKDWKGDAMQRSHELLLVCEETPGMCSASNKIKEDGVEELMYPVEETAQPESIMNRRGIPEYIPSRVKLAGLCGEKKGLGVHPCSDLFCCECPATDLGYSPLLASPHGAGEHLRNVGHTPSSTCIIPAHVQYGGGTLANIPCSREPQGSLLHSSFTDKVSLDTCTVKMNESNPEGYVIISKD